MSILALAAAGRAIAGATAVIGVISAFFALVFLLLPNLVPWTTARADIHETKIEHNAYVEQILPRWYRDISLEEATTVEQLTTPEGRPESGSPVEVAENETIPYDPQTIGNVISYRAEVEGYKAITSKRIRVFWSLHDAESGQRVSDPNLIDQRAWPTRAVTAHRRLVVATGDAFVPLPTSNGTYFVRLEAWDEDRGRLDVEDTKEFEVVDGSSKEPKSRPKETTTASS